MARIIGHAPDSRNTENGDYRATSPRDISFQGWKSILSRVKQQLGSDHVSIIASGVAFNVFLAIFPLAIAAVTVYSLVIDPSTLQSHLNTIASVLPSGAQELISNRLQALTQNSSQTLGWGLAVSLLLTLWAANRGTKALFEGINIAYNAQRSRGFIRNNLVTLLFTVGGLVFGGICLALLIGVPAAADALPFPDPVISLIKFIVWPLLFGLIIVALGVIYKVAPVRSNPQTEWVTVGSIVAAVIWLIGSALFSWFVANFGNYDKTYGSVAAVVVLMTWLLLTSFVILLGAEINTEIELQTAEDTTVGEEKPMGQRDAYHADHVVK
ncbi:YihY/virulence factor BrkB family protein [Proteobacteria bacterium 005FR1]|nr:YihY/virulence factor BrkB family protein [Proteobacteria bacterium 005FR1]